MHDNVDVINEFSCYEVKIAKSRQSDNHQPSRSSICTTQVVLNASCTPGSHSVCAVKTLLGVNQKETTQHGFFPDEENFPVDSQWSSDSTY